MGSAIQRYAVLGLCSVSGVWLTACGPAPKPVQYTFEPGATYEYSVDQITNVTVSSGPFNMFNDSELQDELTFTVLEMGEFGDAKCEVVQGKFDLQSRMSVMGQRVEFDSTDPENPFYQVAEVAVGNSFNVFVDKTGAVSAVTGLETMWNDIMAKADLPPAEKVQMRQQMQTQLDSDNERLSLELALFPALPAAPIEPGQTWTREAAYGGDTPLTLSATYTVDSVEPHVQLSLEGTITPNEAGAPIDMGGITMEMRLNGAMAGSYILDGETGWVRTSEARASIDGQLKMDAPGANLPSSSIPLQMSLEIAATRL